VVSNLPLESSRQDFIARSYSVDCARANDLVVVGLV
jgi:hypothetical protein